MFNRKETAEKIMDRLRLIVVPGGDIYVYPEEIAYKVGSYFCGKTITTFYSSGKGFLELRKGVLELANIAEQPLKAVPVIRLLALNEKHKVVSNPIVIHDADTPEQLFDSSIAVACAEARKYVNARGVFGRVFFEEIEDSLSLFALSMVQRRVPGFSVGPRPTNPGKSVTQAEVMFAIEKLKQKDGRVSANLLLNHLFGVQK
ncbi:hypothetical protein PQC06_gp097 [Aeromonas phage LAh10]|uniref:Uncharacterized protein n=1 Tax=Aeromonas phage LAh10 TaxID=2591025 RepID=A0A514A1N6_9CAUD|nr:hypothetical protein PQC06_gp097 [Aeromonas phage LAh10]QDH47145.1 hypothetical protein LAh10_97 [Aeromonas phage LAh10]